MSSYLFYFISSINVQFLYTMAPLTDEPRQLRCWGVAG